MWWHRAGYAPNDQIKQAYGAGASFNESKEIVRS